MANNVAFAPQERITTGQAPAIVAPNARGEIADAGNIRQDADILRDAAKAARHEANKRIAEEQQLVLNGEVSVGAIHHVAVRNLEGGPGGRAAFAAKQGEMLRFLATVEELLDKAPRAQVVAKLDSQKAQLELTIKALLKLRELLPNDPRSGKKKDSSQAKDGDNAGGSTTQAAPPITTTSGSAPMTTNDFRNNPDVLKAARLLSQQHIPELDKLLETTGNEPDAQQAKKDSKSKGGKVGKIVGLIENGGYAAAGALNDLLTSELTRLKELVSILDSDATVNSQLRSLEGVLGQGKFGLEMERVRTDGQQMQGFNNYIAESARWHFIADLNMNFGMILGALGLNFSPFAAGSLPMDLMQAAISGRGDLWVKSEGVTDPKTGEPMWYIPKGGNLREMLVQQYAKGGVMDERITSMYERIIEQFQPVIDRFNNRAQKISLFPEDGVGGSFQDVMKYIQNGLGSFGEWSGVFDLDPTMEAFGDSLLLGPQFDKDGKPEIDPATGKQRIDKKPTQIKGALDKLFNDPIDREKKGDLVTAA